MRRMNATPADNQQSQEFIAFACELGVLRFGEFKTKAGRLSPYFFNAGAFNDGAALARLCEFYAQRILAAGLAFDVLFGPAYKGIPLAASIAIALAGMAATRRSRSTARKPRITAKVARWSARRWSGGC